MQSPPGHIQQEQAAPAFLTPRRRGAGGAAPPLRGRLSLSAKPTVAAANGTPLPQWLGGQPQQHHSADEQTPLPGPMHFLPRQALAFATPSPAVSAAVGMTPKLAAELMAKVEEEELAVAVTFETETGAGGGGGGSNGGGCGGDEADFLQLFVM